MGLKTVQSELGKKIPKLKRECERRMEVGHGSPTAVQGSLQTAPARSHSKVSTEPQLKNSEFFI